MKFLCVLGLYVLCAVAFVRAASPEENRDNKKLLDGQLVEGDMMLTRQQSRALFGGRLKRAAMRDTSRLWSKGVLIYNIDRSLGVHHLWEKNGGRQDLWLAPGCRTKGIVVHEIGHALGLYHEQSRPDRDKFVKILTQNILPDERYRRQFRKMSPKAINTFGFPYDYGSVMHYGPRFFSRNGKPTIMVKQAGVTIGQRRGLSPEDWNQMQRLYQFQCRR